MAFVPLVSRKKFPKTLVPPSQQALWIVWNIIRASFRREGFKSVGIDNLIDTAAEVIITGTVRRDQLQTCAKGYALSHMDSAPWA